uniref:Uncharacterized protein n=1 Tax=Magallana gigas TaxID=29159 RepID=A0A8W8ICY9_MAGGI
MKSLIQKDTPEKQFKGALYVVLGIGKRTLASKRSWELKSAEPRESRNRNQGNHWLSRCCKKTYGIWCSIGNPRELSDSEVQKGQEFENSINESNKRLYVKVVEDCSINQQWKLNVEVQSVRCRVTDPAFEK